MSEIRPFDERHIPGGDGAPIAVADWPGTKGPLVCIHGITSHSRAFAGLATELPDHRIVAVDCRGRGQSAKEGPYGLVQHAGDVAAVMDELGIDRATVVGHSMGSYVASAFNADYPERVDHLVFVDGGYWQEYPPETAPEELLESTLGIFLTKIRRTWTSVDEYFGYYENTPVYPHGLDLYAREHFGYDLTGESPTLRSRIVEECLAPDWREVIDHDVVGKRLEQVRVPLLLIRAPGGLTGTGDEIITDQVRDEILDRVPHAQVVDLPGTNHHTVLFSLAGAQAVARAIEEFTK